MAVGCRFAELCSFVGMLFVRFGGQWHFFLARNKFFGVKIAADAATIV